MDGLSGTERRGCKGAVPRPRTTLRSCASLLLFLLCVGCAPIPHQETLVPRFFGTVRLEGAPLAGAQVHVSRARMDFRCSAAEHETMTDGAGRFDIPAVTELRLYRSAFGDKYYSYFLCVTAGQTRYTGLVTTGVGPAPDAVGLACAIDRDSQPTPNDAPLSLVRKLSVCSPAP